MKFTNIVACAAALFTVQAISIPETNARRLSERHVHAPEASIFVPENALEKRKGGGKGGGGGGGGSKSGGSTGGGSSRTSTTSNLGGSTAAGSGPSRSYGGSYGGGGSVPYASGQRSNKGVLAGGLLGVGVAAAIFPGLWLWSVYPYYLNNPYRFVNRSMTNSSNPNGVNTTLPVTCLCQQYSVCGCDENDNADYINSLVGNGSYAGLNKSLVNIGMVNGTTQSLILNGTLPNGTTAPGGTDDAAPALTLGKYAGYWVMGLIVLYTVFLI